MNVDLAPDRSDASKKIKSHDNKPIILKHLEEIYEQFRDLQEGKVATYIPELAKVDPDLFGICLVTANGQVYEVGQSRHLFTIQSISKPFVYGLACEDLGFNSVLEKVGVEPTGRAFNSIIFDEVNNRPYNPLVNAGAIATTSLVKGDGFDGRFARILRLFERFSGHSLTVDEAVFQSEKSTGHRNRAIAYLELSAGMIDEPIDENLDLYFHQCSILVTAKDLAVMAATLASNGINPLTQRRAIDAEQVRSILSIMTSCGMYDFSGEWLYRVGLPAKSGVGGGIIAVLPGQFGIGVFSPPLDANGNSVRGIKACKALSETFKIHLFDSHVVSESFLSRKYDGIDIASQIDKTALQPNHQHYGNGEIVIYELQGNLSFTTMERLICNLQTLQKEVKFLVLDGHRVNYANSSAVCLMHECHQWLAQREVKILFVRFCPKVIEDLKALGLTDLDVLDTIDAAFETL